MKGSLLVLLFAVELFSVSASSESKRPEPPLQIEVEEDDDFYIPTSRSFPTPPAPTPVKETFIPTTQVLSRKRSSSEISHAEPFTSPLESPQFNIGSSNEANGRGSTNSSENLRLTHRRPATARRSSSMDSNDEAKSPRKPKSSKAKPKASKSPKSAAESPGSGIGSNPSSVTSDSLDASYSGIIHQADYIKIYSFINDPINRPASTNKHFSKFECAHFTPQMQSELLEAAMRNGKESMISYLLKFGFRFQLSPIKEEVKDSFKNLLIDSKKKTSSEFKTVFLDCDPEGFMKLFIATDEKFPASGLLDVFIAILKTVDGSVDSEAIQLAADCAADLHSLSFFEALFDSDLMIRMISREKLIHMFSKKPESSELALYRRLLTAVVKDRKITPPFAPNLLAFAVQLTKKDATLKSNFFNAIVQNRIMESVFDWEHFTEAIVVALSSKQFNIVHFILSQSNGFKNSHNIFRYVSNSEFVNIIGTHANAAVLGMFLHATTHDGTTMLVSDLGLVQIYLRAIKTGNIEVVEYVLKNGYFDLNDRFSGHSIFNVALNNGQFALARYLIKVFNYSIFDSDTPQLNPSWGGGDSLLYLAPTEKNIPMFRLLLKLGANPNTRTAKSEEKIIYGSIKAGSVEITRLLLQYKCTFNAEKAQKFNTSSKSAEISKVLEMFPLNQTQ